ncbi:SDR family oxidoreductase [Devosia sp.]|uniref:SDR family NAD(P)-dependent oxidoreductase n=1 Tax=Devosia sp. TaxID=1871048 RepID=UPI001AC437FE|nr:SDR family oxidoreductase [Devosia sp.]MBN9334448.1 SDR family oxidoreductase [Devosia sp.]
MSVSRFANYPSLEGRSVLITGGASGIGASLVANFCAQGARVSFLDIDIEAADRLVEAIPNNKPCFVACDLRDTGAVAEAVNKIGLNQGPIAALCNNAGNDDRHRTLDIDAAYWDDRMAVNLRHQFFAAKAVIPQMKVLGGGSIINLGSITWMVGDADCPAYVTAKAAVYGMTRALAREFGPDAIRVNCLVPGWVMTERQKALWLNEAGERQIAERQCLTARLQPDDIARMALFLAADDSAMCTSQQYIVDAGWV